MVELACRFVADDEVWVVDEGSSDCNPLHLSAGELIGIRFESIDEPYLFNQFFCFCFSLFVWNAINNKGNRNIFLDGEAWNEVESLKDKAYMPAPVDSFFTVAHLI